MLVVPGWRGWTPALGVGPAPGRGRLLGQHVLAGDLLCGPGHLPGPRQLSAKAAQGSGRPGRRPEAVPFLSKSAPFMRLQAHWLRFGH